MGGLIVIGPRFDIDLLRESVDDPVSFGKRRAAFQLERQVQQAAIVFPLDLGEKGVYTRNMSRCYCSQLRTATRRVGSVYDDALAPLGINIAQYSLLRLIERRQPLTFTELGRVAELDRSTVGRNVRVLERMGLVEMGRGEEDQREAVVRLAVRGCQVLEEAAPLWDECQRDIETRLGPANVKALRAILSAI